MNMFFPGGWREQMGTMDIHIPCQIGNQRATKRLSQAYDRLFVYIFYLSLPSSWLENPPFICHWPCLCAARVNSYHLLTVCETQICSPVSEPKLVQWLYLEVGWMKLFICGHMWNWCLHVLLWQSWVQAPFKFLHLLFGNGKWQAHSNIGFSGLCLGFPQF